MFISNYALGCELRLKREWKLYEYVAYVKVYKCSSIAETESNLDSVAPGVPYLEEKQNIKVKHKPLSP